jgi:hypothetical protein
MTAAMLLLWTIGQGLLAAGSFALPLGRLYGAASALWALIVAGLWLGLRV